MMNKCNIKQMMSKVDEPGNKESLIATLLSFSELDNDFNGLEYLPDFLWKLNGYEHYNAYLESGNDGELKYSSYKDYVVEELEKLDDEEKIVEQFCEMWLGSDTYYYRYASYDLLTDENGHVTTVCVAYSTTD